MVDVKRIWQINSKGLFYLTQEAEKIYIDFAECCANKFAAFIELDHLKQYQATYHLSDAEMAAVVERRRRWRYVAEANPSAKPYATLEFYTQPLLRFEFASSEKFKETCLAIKAAGWLVYDLSYPRFDP